jgi:apolipoprotein N-acyltransferase
MTGREKKTIVSPDAARMSPVTWAHYIGALDGWRRAAAALALGGLSAAALPPVYATPALVIAFPGLVWLIDGAVDWKRAFRDGWWFGFGHFIGGLYWVANALLVDAAQWAWLIPFAVLCIPAILAFYIAAVGALVQRAQSTALRILLLGCGWTLAEWLRGQLFSGFPWNPIGSVWAFSDVAIQPAAAVGVLGLGFFTVLACAMPAALRDLTGRTRWALPAAGAALIATLFAYGAIRLPVGEVATVPGVTLRVVQPNIPQHLKWQRELRDHHIATLLRLSRQPASQPITHLIWPETSVPFVPSADVAGRAAIASVIPEGGLLLTGAIRTTMQGVRPFRIWNSLHAIDRAGRIVATYDKFHLVPFGEYMPLGDMLGLKKFTAGRTDFSAGPGPRTLKLPGLPAFSPLICYEIIFPGNVTAPRLTISAGQRGERPGWLLNVTNDAWFGNSAGPRQHLVAARFRAVEQGLPVVRAANTGISAIIDPYGRLIGHIGLGLQGSVDSALPRALKSAVAYSSFGDSPILFLCLMLSIAILAKKKLFNRI